MGNDALIAELVASELMALLGIHSPPHSLMQMNGLDGGKFGIPIDAGVSFVTEWQDPAFTFSGRAEPLQRIDNPEVISALLVFDTWIQNFDRFVLDGQDSTENRDNLLFVPSGNRLRLLVIDHSHAFVETTFEDEMDGSWGADRRLCGVHHTFATFLTDADIYKTLDAICALGRSELEQIVQKVPGSWGLTSRSRQNLVDGLIRRAGEMTSWLPQAILDQPALSFELGKR
jgi:hypothetical protein